MPVLSDAGTVDTIFSAGDVIANHCKEGLDSPNRFGDRILRHARNADGTWSNSVAISRENLPWMAQPTSDSYVGHFGSPAVVRLGGKWYMAFAASVSDPNLCAGEHAAPTACGSCTSPWSHFAMLWAVSDDGVTWRVRDSGNANPNPALAAAVVYREPSASDATPSSGYKAAARFSMVTGTDSGKTYFYVVGLFWAAKSPKTILVRIPYDAGNAWGIGGDPEIVHLSLITLAPAWEAVSGGRLPDWVDDFQQQSVLGFFNAFTTSVFATTKAPGYRYALLGVGHAINQIPGYAGRNNLIVYALSNDLITWTFTAAVRSTVPFFADGTGYDTSVIDPIAVEDGSGTIHLYVSSNDGDPDDGIARDGVPDCAAEPNFGPTAAYVGAGIYEATLGFAELAPTTLQVVAQPVSVTAGTMGHYTVRVTATDGSVPAGMVSISTDEFLGTSVPLRDGVADVSVMMRNAGTRRVYLSFNTDGLWMPSLVGLDQPVVPPQHHRPAKK